MPRGVDAADDISVPDSLVFGPVDVGTSAQKMLPIANAGSTNVKIKGIIVLSRGAGGFAAPADSFDLAGGASRDVAVEFRPAAEGEYSAFLTIECGGSDRLVEVQLSGVGTIPTAEITYNSEPVGMAVAVDGSTYTTPHTFAWKIGSNHSVSVDSVQGDEGTRYLFSSWSDDQGRAHQIEVTSAAEYAASFATEHYLAVRSSRGEVRGEGWHGAGARAEWQVVQSPLSDATVSGTQYRAREDSGAVAMSGPQTVEVVWDTEHFLTVNTSRGSILGADWYTAGTEAQWQVVQSPLSDATVSGTQYRAREQSGAVAMSGPQTVEVVWDTEHYLTVNTSRGSILGADWYAAGTEAQWQVVQSPVSDATVSGTQYRAREDSGAVLMSGPQTVEVVWDVEHFLTVNTSRGSVLGADWYAAGTEAQWQVVQSPLSNATNEGIRHVALLESGTTLMDRPQTVEVEWREEYRLIKGAFPESAGRLEREIEGEPAAEPDTLWLTPGAEVALIAQANTGYILSTWRGKDITDTAQRAFFEMTEPKKVTGIFSDVPVLDLKVEHLNFESVQVKMGLEQELEMVNSGKKTLKVSNIISNNFEEFKATPLAFLLEAGASRKIVVTFTPQTSGKRTGVLTIQYNLASETEAEIRSKPISVDGEGIQHQPPKVEPEWLDFEKVDVDKRVEKVLIVANRDSSVTIKVGEIKWMPPKHFNISPTHLTLPPLQSDSLKVIFKPRSKGPQKTVVKLPYSAGAESGELKAELEGEGEDKEIGFDKILNYLGQILGLILAIAGIFELARRVLPVVKKKWAERRGGGNGS